MRQWLGSKLTYANGMATIAVFVALGGGAYAASQIGPNDIKRNAVRSKHIENGQVRSADIGNGQVRGADVDESTLQGLIRSGATIPSGVTVRGNFAAHEGGTGSHVIDEAINFPIPAPQALTPTTVNFAPGSNVGTDDDQDCTGSLDNPTAPPGKVCLYEGGGANASTAQGYIGAGINARLGFLIIVNGSGEVILTGSWAYRAP